MSRLTDLANTRDALAGKIKQELFDAEFNGQALPRSAGGQLFQCQIILLSAAQMARQNGG